MADLHEWLEVYGEVVIQNAVAKLSQDETVKLQIADSVRVFLHALSNCSLNHTLGPVSAILNEWVQGRSTSPEGDVNSLLPLVITLKEVIWQAILDTCSSEIAISLLTTNDRIFTEAITYLASIENTALLDKMRDQLHRAQTRVKHLDKSKSNFIAVAAHELRTPLTLVEGYIDMMGAIDMTPNQLYTAQLIDGVKSGTKRLRDIINDIIDVSLLDLRMMEFHFQPVWLHQLLNAVEKNVRKQFASRNVEIHIEPNSIPREPTYADPDRLLQAIQKVVMNAVKYTPDGSHVLVKGRAFPGFTDIMVIDNGVGIASSNLTHIFDSFSAVGDASLHSSGKTKFMGGGPGLGLPIAKGIIEAHGGTIWAESDGYNEVELPGSTFHIMIPMGTTPPDQTIWRTQKT